MQRSLRHSRVLLILCASTYVIYNFEGYMIHNYNSTVQYITLHACQKAAFTRGAEQSTIRASMTRKSESITGSKNRLAGTMQALPCSLWFSVFACQSPDLTHLHLHWLLHAKWHQSSNWTRISEVMHQPCQWPTERPASDIVPVSCTA